MARHGLSRPPRPSEPIPRHAPQPHDRWVPNRLTGSLWLRLETLPDRYVSPGTGRLTLTTSGAGEIVAQQAARAAGTPVLPGSGIKGALRTLYELLSFSCDPFARGNGCSTYSCCDACSLFGLPSYSGRLSFGDAVPVGEKPVRVEVRKTPIPWTPKRDRTPGDFRLYDLGEATLPGAPRKTPQTQPRVLAREVFTGAFETRMSFSNLTHEEAGRLLLAFGLGRELKTRFYLRLGGVKYDGQGAVRVMPQKLRLARKEVVEGDACRAECARWIESAGTSSWAATFWPTLDELAAVLGPRNGREGTP